MFRKDSTPDLTISNSIKRSSYDWCLRYRSLFEKIESDKDLKASLKKYSVYAKPAENLLGTVKVLNNCMHNAYDSGVVVKNYREIIESTGLSEETVDEPTSEWVQPLTEDQLLACIAWHFRRDYFNNGSWISDSVANGYMLILVTEYLIKYHDNRQN